MIYKLPTMQDVYSSSNRNLFNVVSTFAGCGGSSTGYRLAGGKVLAMNEFIESAWKCYEANYPSTKILKDDIRNLTGQGILDKIEIPFGELDILDGSPPCASFSMAGKREEGWGKVKKYSNTEQRVDDLFYEFARILKEMQPKVFIAENVKGLTLGGAINVLGTKQTDMFGDYKKTILYTLEDCGYNVEYKVLDASMFGVPQVRKRLIIMVFLYQLFGLQ